MTERLVLTVVARWTSRSQAPTVSGSSYPPNAIPRRSNAAWKWSIRLDPGYVTSAAASRSPVAPQQFLKVGGACLGWPDVQKDQSARATHQDIVEALRGTLGNDLAGTVTGLFIHPREDQSCD